MAGDWIKMRIDLQSHPKVVRILSAMQRTESGSRTDKFRVVGGLHAVWSVFDTHSEDGFLHGYTPDLLDQIVGLPGIAQGMIDVGWLVSGSAQTLVMPEFTEHNGKSGKRRAEDQKRKKESRKSPQNVRILSAIETDKNWTREEKRREEKKEERDADTSPCEATSQKTSSPSKATRLSADWTPSAEDREYLTTKRPDLEIDLVAENFRDFWISKSGAGATKLDWSATWRTWVRNEKPGKKCVPVATGYTKTIEIEGKQYVVSFGDYNRYRNKEINLAALRALGDEVMA